MPSLIAIDLGTHAVKVTALRRTGRRFALEGHAVQRVPQDGTSTPGLEARMAALDALLEANRAWQSPGTEVLVAWAAERTLMRRLVLPFVDKAQVQQALPFSVEGEIPFDLDEVVFAPRLVPRGDKTQAFVQIVRHDELGEWLGALAERQVDPMRVLAEGELAATLCPAQGVHALVDVGHAFTVVSLVRDGFVELVRTIDVAGLAFTRAVRDALGVSWEDAEAIKHGEGPADPEVTDGAGGPGEPTPMPEAARQAVEAQVGLLLAEVRSTLIDAEDRLGCEVGGIVLVGGGARLPALARYLQTDLGVPVSGPPDREGEPVAPELALCDALAQHLMGTGTGKPVDLRVGDLAFRGGVDVLKTAAVLAFAGVGFLTVAALALFVVQYIQLTNEQAEIEARIVASVQDVVPDAGNVTPLTALSVMAGYVGEVQARAAVLGAGSAEPPTPAMLLALTEAFPPPGEVTVDVNELTIGPKTVTFNAETDGYATASAVEAALQASPRFAGAEKSNEQKSRDKVTFTITIPLDAPASEEG